MIDTTGLGSVAGLARDIIGWIWAASMSDAEKAEARLFENSLFQVDISLLIS